MISHSKKLIFLHIPKTGGYTIKDILLPHSNDEIYKNQNGNLGPGTGWRMINNVTREEKMHATAKWYQQYVPRSVFEEYTKFTVVRNPWERILSWCSYINGGTFDRDKFKQAVGVINGGPVLNGWFGSPLELSQFEYIIDGTGNVVADEIILYENFHEGLATFFKTHDVEFNESQLGTKTNATSGQRKGHYSEYYDEEMIQLVNKACAQEIEYFGYEFEQK